MPRNPRPIGAAEAMRESAGLPETRRSSSDEISWALDHYDAPIANRIIANAHESSAHGEMRRAFKDEMATAIRRRDPVGYAMNWILSRADLEDVSNQRRRTR